MDNRSHAHGRRLALSLWALAFYLALLYLALRLGAAHPDPRVPTSPWISS